MTSAKSRALATSFLLLLCVVAAASAQAPGVEATPSAGEAASAACWSPWRGPDGTGAAPGADPPTEWSEEHNLRWKTRIPGEGCSTAIVWKDRVYVTGLSMGGYGAWRLASEYPKRFAAIAPI